MVHFVGQEALIARQSPLIESEILGCACVQTSLGDRTLVTRNRNMRFNVTGLTSTWTRVCTRDSSNTGPRMQTLTANRVSTRVLSVTRVESRKCRVKRKWKSVRFVLWFFGFPARRFVRHWFQFSVCVHVQIASAACLQSCAVGRRAHAWVIERCRHARGDGNIFCAGGLVLVHSEAARRKCFNQVHAWHLVHLIVVIATLLFRTGERSL